VPTEIIANNVDVAGKIQESDVQPQGYTELRHIVNDLTGKLVSNQALRLGIFVDSANISDRANKNPTIIDYGALRETIVGDRRLVHARAYCAIYDDYGVPIEKQRTVEPVWGKGFDIVTKPVKVFADGSRKADLDLTLTVDVIRRMESMDVLALVSGDGDFVPLVDYVREKGIRVEVYSFIESMAMELQRAADVDHDLHKMTKVHSKSLANQNGR